MSNGVRSLDPPKQTNQRRSSNWEAPDVTVDREVVAPDDPRRGWCTKESGCGYCYADPGGKSCEYFDHHCETCHEKRLCTKAACRRHRTVNSGC